MKDDATIQMVRKVRHEISKKFDHDPRKLIHYYIKKQKAHTDRIIHTQKQEDVVIHE